MADVELHKVPRIPPPLHDMHTGNFCWSQDSALPVELNGKVAASWSADTWQEVKSVLHVEGSDRHVEGR